MAKADAPSPDRWERVDAIFTEALDLPPESWPGFLEQACAGDVEVRNRVADLLRRSLTVDTFLDRPCLEVDPDIADELAEALAGPPGGRDAPLPAEARIGPYRIVDTLGRGGAGTVYLAERAADVDPAPVALKVLRRGLDTADILQRFDVERQVLATLDHPDVARLLDAGTTDDGRPYLVVELVEGIPITEHCAEHDLSLPDRLRLFVRVARAVQHAHSSLVVHRDLKPSNVLVAGDGAVKLLDFGIAKLLDPVALAGKAPHTRTGARLLTPGYASPEQRRGDPITPASDVYQLGLLLYELVTGEAPYEVGTRSGSGEREAQAVGPIRRRRRLFSNTTGTGAAGGADASVAMRRRHRRDLDRVVARALEEAPEDRYPTAAALAADVERVLAGARAEAAGIRPGLVLRKLARRVSSRRRRAAVAVGAMALLGAVVAGGTLLRVAGPGQPLDPASGALLFDLTPPPWVVVAEFDGTPGDEAVARTVRELVMEALLQAGGVTPVPQDELDAGLRMAGLPATTAVDGAAARELAVRNGFPVVLTGSVVRVGDGFLVRATATDPADGVLLATDSEQSAHADDLMPVVQRLASRLAFKLADALGTRPPPRPATLLTTSSFQAYEHYLAFLRAAREGRPAEMRAALGRALAVDPDFAMAWRGLAIWHHSRGQQDSALVALARAVDLRHSVTDLERLHIEAAQAIVQAQHDTAIELYERILRMNPRDQSAHTNRMVQLRQVGRHEEALHHYEALEALFPVTGGSRYATGRFMTLLSLGRFAEAGTMEGQVQEPTWREGEMLIALGEDRWEAAESLALAVQNDPRGLMVGWRWTQASALAARGSVRAADSTLFALRTWDQGRARLVLALATGCPLAAGRPLPMPPDTTPAALWHNASLATVTGARRLAADWVLEADRRAGVGPTRRTTCQAIPAALSSAMRGNWPAVTQQVEWAAREGSQADYGTTAARWLAAEAYERSGRHNLAAAFFHSVIDPPGAWWRETYLRGFVYPFAHRRLAFLYAGMGEPERAAHHWEVFRATFTHPDAELRWLLEESPWTESAAHGHAGAVPAGAPLFHDGDRACASIDAGRLATFERPLRNVQAAQEEAFQRLGRYDDAWIGDLVGPQPHQQIGILSAVDSAGWTVTVLDFRDTRVCRLSGGRPPEGVAAGVPGEVTCVPRDPVQAVYEDQAYHVLQAAAASLRSTVGSAWEAHDAFPPPLPDSAGRLARPGPGHVLPHNPLFPGVRIEVLEAGPTELLALMTHPHFPGRCTFRVNNEFTARWSC